jgi:hypothetical protein
MIALFTQVTQRIGDPSLGIIVPAIILFISSLVTWLLYKKFSR